MSANGTFEADLTPQEDAEWERKRNALKSHLNQTQVHIEHGEGLSDTNESP